MCGLVYAVFVPLCVKGEDAFLLPPVLKHHGFHRNPVSKGILRFSSFHQLKELFSEIGDLRFGRNKNEWRSDWLRKPEFGCTVTTHVSANLMVL